MKLCTKIRVSVKVGDTVEMELGYSEVCCHLRVAGKMMRVRVLEHGAQILREDGANFSIPIGHGEAGIHTDRDGGLYAYTRVAEWVQEECSDGRVWAAELAEPWVTVSIKPVDGGVWSLIARAVNADLDYLLHGRSYSREGLTLPEAQEWAVSHVESTVRGLQSERRK